MLKQLPLMTPQLLSRIRKGMGVLGPASTNRKSSTVGSSSGIFYLMEDGTSYYLDEGGSSKYLLES